MISAFPAALIPVALALFARPASAQTPPASQFGTVSQTVNTTEITVRYHRPIARGRVLFGGEEAVVLHDALWTPGANDATIIGFDRDVRVEGHAVPAGRYSVWTIPREGAWTFILNRVWDTHHAIYPGEDDDVLRMDVAPRTGAHMETLAIYFPVVGPYAATLHIHWGETILPLEIEVER